MSGYGVRSDGKILFINASTCDINYRPCNPAIVLFCVVIVCGGGLCDGMDDGVVVVKVVVR